MDFDLLGLGVYSPSEVGRYTGTSTSKVMRWLAGYNANGRSYDPLWVSDIGEVDGNYFFSFRDLMEVKAVKNFLEAGVSPQVVRRAIIEARSAINESHPLSSKNFRTDGHTIFLEIATDEKDQKFLDLFKKQYAFKQIIEQSLKDVDYDQHTPSRWWISSRQNGIVIDPERSFGQPIDDETGIPIDVLVNAAKSSDDLQEVAISWDVNLKTLERAIMFNKQFH